LSAGIRWQQNFSGFHTPITASAARALAPQEKTPFGRISLPFLDFRWAPD
jgi:hypothetical protein